MFQSSQEGVRSELLSQLLSGLLPGSLVAKQTNTQMYALINTGLRVCLRLMMKGPAKSRPVRANTALGVTLSAGSWPMS